MTWFGPKRLKNPNDLILPQNTTFWKTTLYLEPVRITSINSKKCFEESLIRNFKGSFCQYMPVPRKITPENTETAFSERSVVVKSPTRRLRKEVSVGVEGQWKNGTVRKPEFVTTETPKKLGPPNVELLSLNNEPKFEIEDPRNSFLIDLEEKPYREQKVDYQKLYEQQNLEILRLKIEQGKYERARQVEMEIPRVRNINIQNQSHQSQSYQNQSYQNQEYSHNSQKVHHSQNSKNRDFQDQTHQITKDHQSPLPKPASSENFIFNKNYNPFPNSPNDSGTINNAEDVSSNNSTTFRSIDTENYSSKNNPISPEIRVLHSNKTERVVKIDGHRLRPGENLYEIVARNNRYRVVSAMNSVTELETQQEVDGDFYQVVKVRAPDGKVQVVEI